MIEEIRLQDIGVIREACLEFSPGLTVLTGETGAGKTMVLTALAMVLGRKADARRVRSGAQKASAEAILSVPAGSAALEIAREAGAFEEDEEGQEMILTRTLSSSGRSRAILSGRSVPASTLAKVGENCVAIHGQTDQLRLKSPSAQRQAVDRYGGQELAEAKASYREAFFEYELAREKYADLTEHLEERRREAAQISATLEEIDSLELKPAEDETLKAEALRRENVDQLRLSVMNAISALAGGGEGESLDLLHGVEQARKALEGQEDELLVTMASRLSGLQAEVNDLMAELTSYVHEIDAESEGGEERLNKIQERRFAINTVLRKYAPSVDALLEWAEQQRSRLSQLSVDDEGIQKLKLERDKSYALALERAEALRGLRAEAGEKLSAHVGRELASLAMADATLEVRLEKMEYMDRQGMDRLSLMLKAHEGAPSLPLGEGASGGELSRIMLAMEVVLAEADPVPTFVFDEVDAGVGGKAAIEIGRRLALLARRVQVIVVTHLPQVAAYADEHIMILKGESDGMTSSDVVHLQESERVLELARMLAGHEDSNAAREHAQELIEEAENFRKPVPAQAS